MRALTRLTDALAARLVVRVLWQGEELDRLLDADHARLVEEIVRRLSVAGWTAAPEVTFHVAGERGSIDVLAWHEEARRLLVVEVKSVVPDIQAMLAGLDRKVRIAPVVARERGWAARSASRLLVLPDDRTARRRLGNFASTFDQVLPARNVRIRRWIWDPVEPVAGVMFLSDVTQTGARHRVRAQPRGIERGQGPRM